MIERIKRVTGACLIYPRLTADIGYIYLSTAQAQHLKEPTPIPTANFSDSIRPGKIQSKKEMSKRKINPYPEEQVPQVPHARQTGENKQTRLTTRP